MSDMNDWNKAVIEEFRANGGKVAQFGDSPVVILHTIGAKSGELREIPLVALAGDDGGLGLLRDRVGGTPAERVAAEGTLHEKKAPLSWRRR